VQKTPWATRKLRSRLGETCHFRKVFEPFHIFWAAEKEGNKTPVTVLRC